MIGLTITLAVLVGISLGLLGGGGSILTVPLLVYVAGIDAQQAIAMSLLVVGVTSAVGAVTHARAGRVSWRIAGLFGPAAMAGAYTGGLLATFVPGEVLLMAFASVMVTTSVAMLRGPVKAPVVEDDRRIPVAKLVSTGLAVGVISGLVGAGGGFLIVPALALLGGLAMPAAIGASLVVIAMQSFAGLAGHLVTGPIDWRLAALITVPALFGGVIGGRLTALIAPATLRRFFAWFVLAVASAILAIEVHPLVGITAAALAVMAAGLTFACARYAFCPLQRMIGFPRPAT